MRRVYWLTFLLLAACAPTIERTDRAFITAEGRRLELHSPAASSAADVAVEGVNLAVTSTYCAGAAGVCAPTDGWVVLKLPEGRYDAPVALGSYTGTVTDAVGVVNPFGLKTTWCVVLQGAKPCQGVPPETVTKPPGGVK